MGIGVIRSVLCGVGLLVSCQGSGKEAGPAGGEGGPGYAVADLIIVADEVHTLGEGASGGALAIADGRILAVSTADGILRYRGGRTTLLRFPGAHVFPGLIDAHAHLAGLGAALETVDLRGARSYREVIERVLAQAARVPKGTWVEGRGWDQNLWPDVAMPDHRALSAEVPDHPVWLRRVDGHAALANRRAMELAGVDGSTRDPAGGRMLRFEDGAPTGVFVDTAMGMVGQRIPAAGMSTLRRQLLLAQERLLQQGLTRIHDAGTAEAVHRLLRELEGEGEWKLGIYGMLPAPSGESALPSIEDAGPRARLRFRAVKLYADGALGSRGAALLADYRDEPGNQGLLTTPEATLRAQIGWCRDAGYQPCVHAIGDRANRIVLNAYEELLSAEQRRELRPRIEHAQVLAPEDLARFAPLGVIASMQPTHLTSDMAWAASRLGPDRVSGAYAFRTLLETGAPVAFGSDFPVEPESPFDGLFAAVTTRPPAAPGQPPYREDQCVTRRQALEAFTMGAAYAGFEEAVRGRILPGYEADLTIVDRNLLGDGALLGTRVLATLVGGELAYRRATEER